MASERETAAERVRELLERIAGAAGAQARVTVQDGPEGLLGTYEGDEAELLVGRHGETLDAIQHLAYRIATRGDAERVSVTIDAGGYRERRAGALRQIADQAAQTALTENRAVSLEAMSALERKVIHEHLKARRELETYSEGQEPARHLVVAPVVAD